MDEPSFFHFDQIQKHLEGATAFSYSVELYFAKGSPSLTLAISAH